MNLLLVEDDRHIQMALARALTAHGHAVAEAGDVQAATAMMRDHSFDLLIVDINLPDATGWDVLRSQAGSANAGTPVVVMSAVSPSVARLRQFKPLGVLLKPFPIDALLLLVRQAGQYAPAAEVRGD